MLVGDTLCFEGDFVQSIPIVKREYVLPKSVTLSHAFIKIEEACAAEL